MDVFTDVDLLCDLMEASNKRRVPVYILLDEKNLGHFTDMCSTLDIQNSHLSVSTAHTSTDCRATRGQTLATPSDAHVKHEKMNSLHVIPRARARSFFNS